MNNRMIAVVIFFCIFVAFVTKCCSSKSSRIYLNCSKDLWLYFCIQIDRHCRLIRFLKRPVHHPSTKAINRIAPNFSAICWNRCMHRKKRIKIRQPIDCKFHQITTTVVQLQSHRIRIQIHHHKVRMNCKWKWLQHRELWWKKRLTVQFASSTSALIAVRQANRMIHFEICIYRFRTPRQIQNINTP